MAKKTMKVKKRKYTRRKNVEESIKVPMTAKEVLNKTINKLQDNNFEVFNPNGGDLGRDTTQQESRASINSFVFVDGCKVLIRNLPDEYLFNLEKQKRDEMSALEREYYLLKELNRNINFELTHRKL